MGKKGGFWWFSAVKRAFRSPSKDSDTKSNRKIEEHEKRREKRRWIFLKTNASEFETRTGTNEHRHALAVAKSTAAAAEAAATTAQATAVEMIRLTRPFNLVREQHHAALLIQTAFRAYLARRALRALRGIVKLQAIVRGHNVRTQAKMMKKCMEAMDRVQARVNIRRSKLSHEATRKSMFVEKNDFWDIKHHPSIGDRKSISRDRNCFTDGWDDRVQKTEGIKDMSWNRDEAASKREKGITCAFPNTVSRTGWNKSVGKESELIEDGTKWLNRWMSTRQWESNNRVSTDQKDNIKTFKINTSFRPYSYSAPINHVRATAQTPASPRTPHSSKIRQLTVRSDSPRFPKDERRSFSTTTTPNLGSTYCFTGAMCRARACASAPVPNYMAATESAIAKSRVRSKSTPRTRPSTPERERCGSARKRLSYPAPEPHYSTAVGQSSVGQNWRSPSFKSIEQRSNDTDSLGGEVISHSTTDLRAW